MKSKDTKSRNAEVVGEFLCHAPMEGTNIHSTGDKLLSYGTVIAQWIDKRLVINQSKYSKTTKQHLDILNRRRVVKEIQIVVGVDKGVEDLTPYLANK